MNPWIVAGLIAWAFIGVFGAMFVYGGTRKPTPPPPARPRARKVHIDLDDIEWDWRRV